jgi:hypothetical protein
MTKMAIFKSVRLRKALQHKTTLKPNCFRQHLPHLYDLYDMGAWYLVLLGQYPYRQAGIGHCNLFKKSQGHGANQFTQQCSAVL